jgi:hypothetical protein
MQAKASLVLWRRLWGTDLLLGSAELWRLRGSDLALR